MVIKLNVYLIFYLLFYESKNDFGFIRIDRHLSTTLFLDEGKINAI